METLTHIAESVATDREQFFEDLYKKAFPPFAHFAAKMNASLDDTRDVFHDALLIYCEKTQDPSFVVRRSPEAYVLGIARHLWFRKFHRDRHVPISEDIADITDIPDDFTGTREEISLLQLVERAGRRCLELLSKFYFENASLREISSWLGYRTEHSAAVQKFKCIGKIRNYLKSQAIRYEDLHC